MVKEIWSKFFKSFPWDKITAEDADAIRSSVAIFSCMINNRTTESIEYERQRTLKAKKAALASNIKQGRKIVPENYL